MDKVQKCIYLNAEQKLYAYWYLWTVQKWSYLTIEQKLYAYWYLWTECRSVAVWTLNRNCRLLMIVWSVALRPQKTVGLLGTGAQDGHLDFHTAPELWNNTIQYNTTLLSLCREICLCILVLMDRMQKCSYLTLNRKVMYAGTYGQSAEM